MLTRYKKPHRVKLFVASNLLMMAFGANAAGADLPVYTEELAPAWADWSWGTTRNFTNATLAHNGTKALSVRFDQAYAGFYLHTNFAFETRAWDRLSFWVHGGAVGNQQLRVYANEDSTHSHSFIVPANTWTQVIVPMSALGSPATLSSLSWREASGSPQPEFFLDDVVLLASSATSIPLRIDASAERHPISDDIYGMNFGIRRPVSSADEAMAAELKLPVRRWGGNATTRYNWRTGVASSAADWYFENIPMGDPATIDVTKLPSGSASDQFVEQNRRTGARTIMTVPLIGWTPRMNSPRAHPFDCGFNVSRYGSQQDSDPWDTACGNGVRPDGQFITGNNPTDTSEAIGTSFVTDWIKHLVGKYGTAANGGVAFYNLDNEPELWNSTHRDVHPLPASYDELLIKTTDYAAAVKAADPGAKTLGPALSGWCGYFYSALDGCRAGTDFQNHGNQAFTPWYLSQLKAYEQIKGIRLLDYLDLHMYPAAPGVALLPAGDAFTQALRLRSTRALWDSTYTDESWISNNEPYSVKVGLIARMKDWVNTYYPGTKLAISEYNWGALDHINGALAQADVLGIFGREGMDLATLWLPIEPNEATDYTFASEPGAYAFRMFRNYDGAMSRFGNTAVRAISSQQGDLAVYAAERSSDKALTVLVINKTSGELVGPLEFAGIALPPTASAYRYSAANLQAIERLPDQAISGSGFTSVFPANSMSLFVLSPAGASAKMLTVTTSGSGTVSTSVGTLTWNANVGSATYGYGTQLSLTAAANAGSAFAGWSGCDSSSGNVCSLNMTATKAVTAAFNALPCTYSISPSSKTFPKNGGSGSVSLTASSSTCQWTAASNAPWITLGASSFSGNATVKYTVAKNLTRAVRTGTMTIADKIFTVTEAR